MIAAYRESVWLKKALPKPDAEWLVPYGFRHTFRRARPFAIHGVESVAATDGWRMHIIRKPAPGIARRGSADERFGRNINALLDNLNGQAQYVATFRVERGMLRRLNLRRYPIAPVMLLADWDCLTISQGREEATEPSAVLARVPIAPGDVTPDEHDRFHVQAQYLADALYIFYGRRVWLTKYPNAIRLTDSKYTAVIKRYQFGSE